MHSVPIYSQQQILVWQQFPCCWIGPRHFPSQQQSLVLYSSSLAVGSSSPLSSRVSCHSSSLAVGLISPLSSRVSCDSTSLTVRLVHIICPLIVAESCVSVWHQFWINPCQFPSQQQSLMIRTPEETHTLQETHTPKGKVKMRKMQTVRIKIKACVWYIGLSRICSHYLSIIALCKR